ncbi:MAG: hypothetical protein M1831_006004 [Alyxoria varia]|nr:MAG: hypothetical protein M1831_006004 [Alyxoria varia]
MQSKGDDQLAQDVKRFQTPPIASQQAATLPASFTFHRFQAPPKTPEMPQTTTPEPPSAPGPPKVRIKRRSHPGLKANPDLREFASSEENLLPSIELSEAINEPAASDGTTPPQDDLLAPSSSPASTVIRRFVSPPRTPLAQVFSPGDDGVDWSHFTPAPRRNKGHSVARPLSPWSELSDSSGDSSDSLDTYPSYGGSCTSPESDAADPFTFTQRKQAPSPSPKQMCFKNERKRLKLKWTDEMDEHLWRTYMAYLADPRNTPFKTLPGAPPPLGVCHRVTRIAKKTWKTPRTTLQTVAEDGASSFASLDGTLAASKSSPAGPFGTPPATVKPGSSVSRSSGSAQKPSATWFKSASATRRRLRYLCKRRPSLSPHYQRLLRSRSPSPIEPSSQPQPSSSMGMTDSTSFATRDLNVNLAASTASSMQPGGPLARLTMEGYESRNKTPTRLGQHQKSQSLQRLGVGMQTPVRQQNAGLSSPFEWYRSDQPAPGEPRTVHAAPVELHHPKPLSSSMKRRAAYALGEEMLSDDPDARRNALEDMFNESGGIGNGKRRVRSRGFSTGAVNQSGTSSRHISQVFDPPGYPMPHIDPEPESPQSSAHFASQMQPEGSNPAPSQTWHAAPPAFDPSRTLGSPFAPRATSGTFGLSNTFPRSLFPEGLDSISSLDQQRQGNDHGVHGDHDDDDPFSDPSRYHNDSNSS